MAYPSIIVPTNRVGKLITRPVSSKGESIVYLEDGPLANPAATSSNLFMNAKYFAYSKRYFRSIIISLSITALAKLVSATGSVKVLDIPDGLLPLTVRETLIMAAVIELSVVFFLTRSRSVISKLVLIEWLGTNFLLYRFGALLLTVGKPCPCLGSATAQLHISRSITDPLLSGLILYMVIGSLGFLLWHLLSRRVQTMV